MRKFVLLILVFAFAASLFVFRQDTVHAVVPSSVTAASIQRWKVSNGFYALNIFGDGTLLAAQEFAVPVPGEPRSKGVNAVELNPATGLTIQNLVSSDVRSTIRLSNSPAEQDWIIGGYENRPAIRKDGTYVKDLFDLGCCNIPRHPFAYDPVNDRAWLSANGGIGYVHIPTDQRSDRGTVSPNSFGGVSLSDPTTAYTSGQQGYAVKTDSNSGLQWSVFVDSVRLQPGAVLSDGSFVVTSGWAHFEGAPTPGRLARILPSGTPAFNSMINAVTPPVISGNGLIIVGTQPAPINEDGPGAIEARDPTNGNVVWSVPVDGLPNDLLVGDDGAVYAATGSFNNGRIYTIGQTDGAVRQIITDVQGAWEIVLRAGLLYASGKAPYNGSTSITALTVAANNYDPNSPWPVRYHDNQRTSNRTAPILNPARIPAPHSPTPTPTPGPACLGTPTFTQAPWVPTAGIYNQGVAAGDFNEDGNQDLVFSNGTPRLVSVRFGNGTGGFSGSTDLPSIDAPWGIVVEDFNRDQHLDFAVMGNESRVVRVWLGNGDGTFGAPTGYYSAAQWPTSFDAVDVNLDGKLDLLSVDFNSGYITIIYGDGNGAFSPPVSIPVGQNPASAVAADLNNDGIIDLVSANYFGNSLSIRLGTSGGTFVPASDVPVSDLPTMVRADDFDGDGNVDLVVTRRDANKISILRGDGTGAFTLLYEFATPTHPRYAALSDLNNDGKPDIVVVPTDSESLGVFIGDGTGGFTSIPGVFTYYNASVVAVSDFNNDGTPDLASGNASGFTNRIFINLGGCSVPPDTASPTTVASTSPAPNATGWNKTDVGISMTAGDNEGGSGVKNIIYSSSGAQTTATTVVSGSNANLSISAEGVTTITYFAEDNAGNVETAHTLVVRIDKSAPTIAVTSPTASTYLLNQAATVNFTCSDSLSEIASCTGSTSNGSALDTSSIGAKSITINATDNAGNTTSQVVNYTVTYGVIALYDQTRAHKSGSTIPIKVQIVDANGANVSSPSIVVHAVSVVQISIQASTNFGDAGNSNPDFDFRYDSSFGGYIFNLQTTGFGTGSYLLNFVAGTGPTVYSVGFQIRK